MKKFLDLFKIKKSKVVEELTKEFDKKLIGKKKADEDYAKERLKTDEVFKKLMNQDFYYEIDDLMRHFDKKLISRKYALIRYEK